MYRESSTPRVHESDVAAHCRDSRLPSSCLYGVAFSQAGNYDSERGIKAPKVNQLSMLSFPNACIGNPAFIFAISNGCERSVFKSVILPARRSFSEEGSLTQDLVLSFDLIFHLHLGKGLPRRSRIGNPSCSSFYTGLSFSLIFSSEIL